MGISALDIEARIGLTYSSIICFFYTISGGPSLSSIFGVFIELSELFVVSSIDPSVGSKIFVGLISYGLTYIPILVTVVF